MQIIIEPPKDRWDELTKRPALDVSTLFSSVQKVLEDIRKRGDEAVIEYGKTFDNVSLDCSKVSEQELEEAAMQVPKELKEAILIAKQNIETFHRSQQFKGEKITTTQGVTCWQKATPIEKVGLYIPGGSAPLFSTVLMLAIPAQIADCKEIVLCSPPSPEGKIHPAILFAANVSGVRKVYKIGGIQAIAAMAFGTETVPKVYKIFGPGNQYVTAAKQLVSLRNVAIDMPAGPSEVLIIADDQADPLFIAADLLSQAEHGADSQSLLIASSEELAHRVIQAVNSELERLPRKDIAKKALQNSRIIVLNDVTDAIEFSNLYAPEHLIIQTNNYQAIAERITQAGSVFLGAYTPESAGDYASGTNHTLPTNGYARAYSGVNLDSFCKKITFQEITEEGIRQLGPVIEVMAANEQLEAHKQAVTVRLNSL